MAKLLILIILASALLYSQAATTKNKRCITLNSYVNSNIKNAENTISKIKREVKGKKCLTAAQKSKVSKQITVIKKCNSSIKTLKVNQKHAGCKISTVHSFNIPHVPHLCPSTHKPTPNKSGHTTCTKTASGSCSCTGPDQCNNAESATVCALNGIQSDCYVHLLAEETLGTEASCSRLYNEISLSIQAIQGFLNGVTKVGCAISQGLENTASAVNNACIGYYYKLC